MADTYSDRLGLIKMEEGTHPNEWGDLANLNFDRLDSSTRGFTSVALSGGKTLTANDITTVSSVAQEESFFAFIEFTGTAGVVTVPAENIMWFVRNKCSSGTLTFTPSGGTGAVVAQDETAILVYGANGTTMTDVTAELYTTAIGSTIQAYDAGLAYLDSLNFTDEATFKSGVNLEIGTDVQAYDATILNAADIGVTVQGYDADTLKADTADQLTTGYTTTVYSIGTGATYTPDFETQGLATWTPSANITINECATAGEYGIQQVLLTPSAAVSVTYGADVLYATANPTALVSGTNYLLTASRFSDTQQTVVIQELA